MPSIPLLANGFVTIYESPDPERIFAYTPGLARLEGGRLHVLSRSGDHWARNAHDGNLITFHTIRDFWELAYI